MYCNPPNFNMHILRKVWEKLKQILHANKNLLSTKIWGC